MDVQLAEEFFEPDLVQLYKKKLYHQFEVGLKKIVAADPSFLTPKLFREFLITSLQDKVNPIAFLQLFEESIIRGQMTFSEANEIFPRIKENSKELVYLQTILARINFQANNFEKAEELLEEIEKDVKLADTTVVPAFFRAKAEMHLLQNNINKFYHSGTEYLKHAKDEIYEGEKFMSSLAASALHNPEVFAFSELAQNRHMKRYLKEDSKLFKVFKIFADADIHQFFEIQNSVSKYLPNCDVEKLTQKMRLCALLEVFFDKSKDERTHVSFEEISQHCRTDEVEPLLMNALSRKLFRGRIDGIDRCVAVTWIQPRYLDIDRLRTLKKKVQDLSRDTLKMAENLKAMTPELLNMDGIWVN